jgi:putative hydrolase of the HAD superfamily
VALDRVRPRAVLLDALGTLVALEPPAPRLRAALASRGAPVDEAAAARAMRAEIAHYRAHHDEAGTRAGLEALRDACARVVEDELRTGLPAAQVRAALLEAIRFTPYPEVPGVLAALAAAGVALAVVSNWDVSLHDVLRETGLDHHVAVVVTSAEHGAPKPAASIFAAALAALGVPAAEAVHVGDDADADVAGARGAGLGAAVLVHRAGGPAPPVPHGVRVVRSLDALAAGTV